MRARGIRRKLELQLERALESKVKLDKHETLLNMLFPLLFL